MSKQKQIFVAVSDNGSGNIKRGYMMSLWKAIAECGLLIESAPGSDSHANRAMNKISNDFLRSKSDEFLLIDCDILVATENLRMVMSHDEAMIHGIYFLKQPKAAMCLAPFPGSLQPPADGSLWKVRRSGRGFVRIDRSVFEAMKEDNGGPALRFHNYGEVMWDFWPSGVVTGEMAVACNDEKGRPIIDKDGFPRREWISEDWYFCERARALGIPTLVEHRLYARHEGDCLFPIEYTKDMLPEILERFSAEDIAEAMKTVLEARNPGAGKMSLK